MPSTPRRAIVFVDGFNLYHGIKKLGDNWLKWCDVWSLSEHVLMQKHQEDRVKAVRFYTAPPIDEERFGRGTCERHAVYMDALKHNPKGRVEVIESRFGEESRRWLLKNSKLTARSRADSSQWIELKDWVETLLAEYPESEVMVERQTYTEKGTDVRLAIDAVALAYRNEYDRAVIMSADTDFEPVVDHVLGEFQDKAIDVWAPPNPGSGYYSDKAKRSAHGDRFNVFKVSRKQILLNRLPESISNPDGDPIRCPPAYMPLADELGARTANLPR